MPRHTLPLAAKALPPRGGTSLNADAIAQIRAIWEMGKTSKLALARAYGVSNVWITRILEGQDATAAAMRRSSPTRSSPRTS